MIRTIQNFNNYYTYNNAGTDVDKKNKSLLYERNTISFTGTPCKIAWLESLPNVVKSVNVQVKEFLPDTIKVHQQIFGIENTLVQVPNLGARSTVTKDIMPVSYPHLLLFRPYDNIYSLAEVSEHQDFASDFKMTKNMLHTMFPNRDIVFFEHGSSSVSSAINTNSPKTAGKSVTFAHGHFCVMPSDLNFDNLVNETKSILINNNWHNIERNTIQKSSLLSGYKDILKMKNKNGHYMPYIALAHFDKESNVEKSVILLEESLDNNHIAHTPSQLMRKLISKHCLGNDAETNWNYKTLLIKANNGEDYDEFLPKIEEVKKQDLIFDHIFKKLYE